MRIIKAGEPEKTWPREYVLPCCKSVVELEPDDILTNNDYQGNFSSYFVNCPVCGRQPDVPSNLKYDGDRWKAQQQRIKEAQDKEGHD